MARLGAVAARSGRLWLCRLVAAMLEVSWRGGAGGGGGGGDDGTRR